MWLVTNLDTGLGFLFPSVERWQGWMAIAGWVNYSVQFFDIVK